jgi:hypothetical protein
MGIPWERTLWFNDVIEGIEGPRQGGARIVIDAQNSATGVGKTSLAIALAKKISNFFGYELQFEDLTLSGAHYLRRWREHPGSGQPSVIVLDELGGAGAGQARRAMSTQNVQLGQAWQLMRKKRIVTIVTLPHWRSADKSMRQMSDYRLWCLAKPIGFFKPYKVGSDFNSGEVKTRGYSDVSRIGFPNMGKYGDPHYEYISDKKDALLESQYFDADKLEDPEELEQQRDPEEIEREVHIDIAQRLREEGKTLKEVGTAVGYSDSWVAKYTDPPG